MKFEYQYLDNGVESTRTAKYLSSRIKKPVLIFSPIKEIEAQKKLYFRSNDKEFILQISLKA